MFFLINICRIFSVVCPQEVLHGCVFWGFPIYNFAKSPLRRLMGRSSLPQMQELCLISLEVILKSFSATLWAPRLTHSAEMRSSILRGCHSVLLVRHRLRAWILLGAHWTVTSRCPCLLSTGSEQRVKVMSLLLYQSVLFGFVHCHLSVVSND